MKTRHITALKPKFRHHLWIFIASISLAILILLYLSPSNNTLLIAFFSVLLFIAFIIVIKYSRFPRASFTLTFMHCQFHSHQGGWIATWHNISQIGPVSINHQGWETPMPWIGIKIHQYSDFITSICPRVTSHILIEQRALLIMACKYNAEQAYQIEDILFDDSPYIDNEGKMYNGLQAMLANRMRYNRELLGYDFFISEDLLDRPMNDFIGLLRRYKAAS